MDVAAPRVAQRSDEPASILRFSDQPTITVQPMPVEVSMIVTPDGRWTSLVRKWSAGESAHCRLCPDGSCVARGDSCHLVTPGILDEERAPLYSTVGLARVPGLASRGN